MTFKNSNINTLTLISMYISPGYTQSPHFLCTTELSFQTSESRNTMIVPSTNVASIIWMINRFVMSMPFTKINHDIILCLWHTRTCYYDDNNRRKVILLFDDLHQMNTSVVFVQMQFENKRTDGQGIWCIRLIRNLTEGTWTNLIPLNYTTDSITADPYVAYDNKFFGYEEMTLESAAYSYENGLTGGSLDIFYSLNKQYNDYNDVGNGSQIQQNNIVNCLILGQSSNGASRGAGYVRNQAAQHVIAAGTETETANENISTVIHSSICLSDSSDDNMNKDNKLLSAMAQINMKNKQHCTLMSCTYALDSTWHYPNWANKILTDGQLIWERLWKVTILVSAGASCPLKKGGLALFR